MTIKSKSLFLVGLLLSATKVSALELFNCDQYMLISAYFSDNVYIFNACDGSFLRRLDDTGRIQGAQATRIGPDGMLYVASEKNGKILRYDATTFEFIDEFVTASVITEPTGLAFDSNGDLFVGSFSGDKVVKVDGTTGQILGDFATGINGPDAGMTFGPDGNLYVPAYSGAQIHVLNGQTGAAVKSISGQLRNPRVVVFDPDNSKFLVSVWGSGSISEYSSGGTFNKFLTQDFPGVAGLAYRNDGQLFAISSSLGRAQPVDATTGAIGASFTASAAISGPTFITFVDGEPAEPIVTNQFWVIGVGSIANLKISLDAESFVYSTGGQFGDAFNPDDIVLHPFGSIDITLTGCSEATLEFNTDGNANMGSGGYQLVKLATNASLTECQDVGFDASTTPDSAFTGAWYGGSSRSGEGFFIDTLTDGRAVVAWFTHGSASAAFE